MSAKLTLYKRPGNRDWDNFIAHQPGISAELRKHAVRLAAKAETRLHAHQGHEDYWSPNHPARAKIMVEKGDVDWAVWLVHPFAADIEFGHDAYDVYRNGKFAYHVNSSRPGTHVLMGALGDYI